MQTTGLRSLSDLSGTWRLARDITHADGTRHVFEGSSVFSWSGPRLIEEQVGHLNMGPDIRLKATRRYVWTQEDERIEVLFDDMRPFHTVPLHVVAPETTHLCPPDRYHVRYDFSSLTGWRAIWDVEGPAKNYQMISRYTRERSLRAP